MSNDLVSAITTDVNVGMDEVVSVFVSKYETELFDRKEDLSKKVKETRSELSGLNKKVKNSINKSEYTLSLPFIKVSSKVNEIKVDWEDEKIKIELVVSDDEKNGYNSVLFKTIEVSIDKLDMKEHVSLSDKLTDLNGQLTEVLGLIKSVGRKERQIRGRISEMKLKESGLADLVNNEDLISLVKLD